MVGGGYTRLRDNDLVGVMTTFLQLWFFAMGAVTMLASAFTIRYTNSVSVCSIAYVLFGLGAGMLRWSFLP